MSRGNSSTFATLEAEDESGKSTVVVVPGWGANAIAFSHQVDGLPCAIPVLESIDAASVAQKPTSFGMPILAPTPGRVGKNQSGRLCYGGEAYTLVPSRHGFLRQLEWEVTGQERDEIHCAVEVEPEALRAQSDWIPYHLLAYHELVLRPGRLISRIRIENRGDRKVPVDVGWHPYLARNGPCSVTLPAEAYWPLDGASEPTPIDRTPVKVHGRYDLTKGRKLDASRSDDAYDDIFTGIPVRDGERCCGVAEEHTFTSGRSATIERRLHLPVTSTAFDFVPAEHVQLYTPPDRAAICLEPLSAPPNAIELSAGFHEIEPGQSLSFEMQLGITVRVNS